MVWEEEDLSAGPYRSAVRSAGCMLELTPARCTLINEIRLSGGGASYSPGDSVLLPELRTAAVAQMRKDEGPRAVGVQVRSRDVLGREVGRIGLCGQSHVGGEGEKEEKVD